MDHGQEWAEESRVPRWVDDYITKQSAWLYHKAVSARGAMETREEHARDTDYARFGLVEKVGQIVKGHQVMSRTIKTSWGCGPHGCLTDDGTRNQAK